MPSIIGGTPFLRALVAQGMDTEVMLKSLIALLALLWILWWYSSTRISSTSTQPACKSTLSVPFIAYHDIDWRHLSRALTDFRLERHRALESLSRQLEIAEESEFGRAPILSQRLQARLDRLSEIFDQDQAVLEAIMRPFNVTKVLPDSDNNRSTFLATKQPPMEATSRRPHWQRPPLPNEAATYDTISQVVAHLVRDWSVEGKAIRQSLYRWCIDQLPSQPGLRILVPGAGLARLAYNLATNGHHVEALEGSPVMAAAAASFLQRAESFTVHAYAGDYFTNEVDSQRRYTPTTVVAPSPTNQGSLSYTVASFGPTTPLQRYHVVVTCFFIDTAGNIYDYLATIHAILQKGGCWINIGPLQWHRNAELHPSADELAAMIDSMGFEIETWSIDLHPIEYRSSGEPRSTHYDAYCPLRFVAVRQ